MAQSRSFLPALVDRARSLFGPIRQSSPEDENLPPDLDSVYSQSPELSVLGNSGPWMNWLLAVNDDAILRREGSQDLRLFDRLLDDDVAMSNLQQRRLAITSRDWEVAPGDDKDPRSVKAAEEFSAMLKALGFDRVTGLLHFAIWYGYGVGEALWTTKVHDGRPIIWLDEIVVPDRRWFGFTLEGELRYTGSFGMVGGAAVPPNKFLTIRTGGSHDFAFYGLGLAHWVYWPVWFKRATTKFWALYLHKLANPTAVGEFKETDGPKEKNKLVQALISIGRDSAVILPEGSTDKINFMEAQRTGLAGSTYREFVKEQNEAIMRIVLGQPGSSSAQPQGIGSGQAEAHADVKSEIVKADADLICEALNGTFAKWVTRWNHGEDVAPPRVFRVLDDAEDLNTVAERDGKLDGLGWQRTEESFEQIYGEGYERKPEPDPTKVDPATGLPIAPPGRRPAAANDDERERRRVAFEAHDPVPLYVRRDLLNEGALKRWTEAQGLTFVDDPHVTIISSTTPVDPFSLGTDDWGGDPTLKIAEGGPRKVERLGKKGAVVLYFASDRLTWRHEDMIRRGASHRYEGYLPHITIARVDDDFDLDAIEPYDGELIFGPERFEEITPDPDPLSMFSAAEEDEIDRLTAALQDETNPILLAFAATLKEGLAEARAERGGRLSLEGARVALLQAFEQFPADRFARLTGLSFLAERAAAEAGVEDRVTP